MAWVGVGLLMHWVPRAKMGGGQCHLLCLVWFVLSSEKLATPGPDVIDVRSFLSDVEWIVMTRSLSAFGATSSGGVGAVTFVPWDGREWVLHRPRKVDGLMDSRSASSLL